MAEVFAISGAPASRVPAGWALTPNRNYGKAPPCPPKLRVGSACRNPIAQVLQLALQKLGTVTGDVQLRAVQADGFIGPVTTAAVNAAVPKYAPDAAKHLRTGNMSMSAVATWAKALSWVLTQAAVKRGAKPDEPAPAPSPQLPPSPFPAPGPQPAPAPTPPPVVVQEPSKVGWAVMFGLNAIVVGVGTYLAMTSVGDYSDEALVIS